MDWIDRYQLFLFDFDGLLVDTESLHYTAYQRMFASYGEHLSLSFPEYCLAAHQSQTHLRETLSSWCPKLLQKEPNWERLYEKKKQIFLSLLETQTVSLMPGAEKLLALLQEKTIAHAVVTNSSYPVIASIRKQHKTLQHIPHWITREDYQTPKPDPECYTLAINRFAKPASRVIGFEDTPRGLRALLRSSAEAVFVPNFTYASLPETKPYRTLTSLEALFQKDLSQPLLHIPK